MKINLGCGTDYREGFVNIDGNRFLPKVDAVIELSSNSLLKYYERGSVEYVLASHILEHFFHWEAVRILKEIYELLVPGGELRIVVPDAGSIVSDPSLSAEEKLFSLYGGQDIPQGVSEVMDQFRGKCPQNFCHKYGWSRARIEKELKAAGFAKISVDAGNRLLQVSAVK